MTVALVDSYAAIDPARRRRHAVRFSLVLVLLGAALGVLWWVHPARFALPLCTWYAMTGLYCPGCGATRATHFLLHGDFAAALRHNAAWILIVPWAFYALASEAAFILRGRRLPDGLLRRPPLYVAMGVVLLAFAIARNLPAYPFLLLAPPS